MTNITIALPDDRLERLRELASRLAVSPEELIRLSIDDLVGRAAEDFAQAADFVLKKNEELYRRLA